MTDDGVGASYLAECDRALSEGDATAEQPCEAIRSLLAGREDFITFEYPCHSPDEMRWFLFRGSGFTLDGRRFVVTSHDDVTRRKLADESLRASRDALESFNAAVSHDIRAPIRRIETLVEIADATATPDELAGLLARIGAEARRARQLTNDLLDLSRVSELPVARTNVNVSELAEEVARTLQASEPGRAVAIDVEPGMTASADARLVRIVLWNLVENAWKFTRDRPDARIDVGSSHRSDGPTEFVVRDNGPGFEPRLASRIFEPFVRGRGPAVEGTGVGLAIVKRAVERHGGEVRAEGSPGRGATFRFTFAPAGPT